MKEKVMIVFEETLNKRLRRAAGVAFGIKRGNLSKAVSDAVELWLRLSIAGTKKYEKVEELID